MKDSGIEWLGKIPKHWTTKKLKELRQIEINNAVTKRLNPNAEMKEIGRAHV